MARISFIVTVFAAVVGSSCALTTQDATNQRGLLQSQIEMHQVERNVETSTRALRENLTLQQAVMSVTNNMNVTPAFVSMIQEVLPSQRNTRHRDHSSHFLGLVNKKSDPYTGLNQAKDLINDMLTEVVMKIDTEHRQCKKIFDDKCQMMEFLRIEVNEMNAQTADSSGDILKFQGEVQKLDADDLPQLRAMLDQNRNICTEKLGDLHRQKSTVEADIQVITEVLGMTDCPKSFIQNSSGVTILKCTDCQGNTTFKFKHEALQQTLSAIKSKTAEHKVLQALKSLTESATNSTPGEVNLPNPCEGVSYDDADVGGGGGCSLGTNPSCSKLESKFLAIQVGMQEMANDLKDQMEKVAYDCSIMEKQTNAEIAYKSTELERAEKELAFATANKQRTTSAAKQKTSEHVKYQGEMNNLRNDCTLNLQNFEAEKCQLEKIRGNLFQKISTNKDDAMFVDCDVGDWMSSGCSADCGGGTETLTREVNEMPMNGGVECPELVAVQECNKHECPVNCVMAPWSGWSSCSAGCDGGIKLRTRTITEHPIWQGTPCDKITETEECATQTCDPDCVLNDWSKWTDCSKACDTGHKHRVRTEAMPAQGAGTCPKIHSPERIEEQTCNVDACPMVETVLTCKAKLDIVVLIDGSGSLGAAAYAKEKAYVKNFLDAFSGNTADAEVGVVLFSGPRYWSEFYECTSGQHQMDKDKLANTCGLHIVQQLSDNMADTKDKIEAMTYPESSTYTSGALQLAFNLLQFRRQEAQQIVVLLTDGLPIDKEYSKAWAQWMDWYTGIRIVVVPIYGLSDEIAQGEGEQLISEMASRLPSIEDNIVKTTVNVDDVTEGNGIGDLAAISTVNTLVEDVCGLGVDFITETTNHSR